MSIDLVVDACIMAFVHTYFDLLLFDASNFFEREVS